MWRWIQRRCRRPWCVGYLFPLQAGEDSNGWHLLYASLLFLFSHTDVLWLPVKVLRRCETYWCKMPPTLFPHTRGNTLFPQKRGREGDATLQQCGGVPEEWIRGRQQPVRLFSACLWETLLTDPYQGVSAGKTLRCLLAALCCTKDVCYCFSPFKFLSYDTLSLRKLGQVSYLSICHCMVEGRKFLIGKL